MHSAVIYMFYLAALRS